MKSIPWLTLALLLFTNVASSATLSWVWQAPIQFTDGNAIPSTDTLTFNVFLGTNGPGSELTTPNQTAVRFTSAVTTGAYTAGMNVCIRVVAVDSAPNTIPSLPSAEFCQVYQPPSQQLNPPVSLGIGGPPT